MHRLPLFLSFLCVLLSQGCQSSNMRYNVYYHSVDVLQYCDSVRFAVAEHFFFEKPYLDLAFASAPPSCMDTLRYVEKILTEEFEKKISTEKKEKIAIRESVAVLLVKTYILMGEVDKARNVLNKMFMSNRMYLYMCEINMLQGHKMLASDSFEKVKKEGLPTQDISLYTQLGALVYADKGQYDRAGSVFISLSKAKDYPLLSMYMAFASAEMYIKADEKNKAKQVYRYIIKKYEKYAPYAQIQLYKCFDPLDEEVDEYIKLISEAHGTDVSALSHYACAKVYASATQHQKSMEQYTEATSEDSSLYFLCAKEKVKNLLAQSDYSAVLEKCAEAIGKKVDIKNDMLFFLEKYMKAYFSLNQKTNDQDHQRIYSEAFDLFTSAEYELSEEKIAHFLDQNPQSVLAPKFRILLSACRGRSYGHGAMVRSMRSVVVLFPDTEYGEFAQRVINMYDKK